MTQENDINQEQKTVKKKRNKLKVLHLHLRNNKVDKDYSFCCTIENREFIYRFWQGHGPYGDKVRFNEILPTGCYLPVSKDHPDQTLDEFRSQLLSLIDNNSFAEIVTIVPPVTF